VQVEDSVEPIDNPEDIPDAPPDDTPVETDVTADTADPPADGEATETATPDPAAATPTEIAAQKEAEDDLAAALGLGKPPEDPKQRAKWWKRQLPYSLVHKTVTEREKKLKETHEGALKEHTTKLADFDTKFTDVKKVEKFIQEQHEPYLRTLAEMFPETYGKFLAPVLGHTIATLPLPDDEDIGERPGPNADLPGGGKTYDLQGIDALMEWNTKKTKQDVLKAFKPHLETIQKQGKEAKTAAEIEARNRTAAKRRDEAVAEMKTWERSDEFFDEIIAEANKLDARYDVETALNIAYRKVALPKIVAGLKADRDKMRADILKEQKEASAKKTATSITTNQVVRTKEKVGDDSNLDVDTRIRNAWKRKGLI
jgi:hypothetical protein